MTRRSISLSRYSVMATITFSLSGCMTTNPATGQQQVDYGATAGVAGAAMGAAALGVALSNNNNDRIVYGGPGWGGGGYRGGHNTSTSITPEMPASIAMPT